MAVKPIPDTSSKIMPRLFCRDAAAEIDFLKAAFAAVELGRRTSASGVTLHGLVMVSGEMVMIESECPSLPGRAPSLDGTSAVVIFAYVENVDEAIERALAAGAKLLMPIQNQFWGDRSGWIMDPSGHVWTVATRIEETTAEERDQRWEKIRTTK